MSTTSLAIRTSLRKSTGGTKKVTPMSADARKGRQGGGGAGGGGGTAPAAQVVAPLAVIDENRNRSSKSDRVLGISSGVHNNVSDSQPTTADNNRSNSSRELDIEMIPTSAAKVQAANNNLGAVRLPPLDHSNSSHFYHEKNEGDEELDRPFDTKIRQKVGFQMDQKPDIVEKGEDVGQHSSISNYELVSQTNQENP